MYYVREMEMLSSSAGYSLWMSLSLSLYIGIVIEDGGLAPKETDLKKIRFIVLGSMYFIIVKRTL